MDTVLSSSTSTYSVFLFTTLSNEDGFINHRTTERAKAHRSICSPMIKVGALLSLHYHSSLSLPIYDYELSGSSVFLSLSSFSQMALWLTSDPVLFRNPLTLAPLLSLGLINSRCANYWWANWIRELTIYWNTIKRLDCCVFCYLCLISISFK